ncbi:MAG: septum site-determining protein MinC [Aquificae bacterium]|nr:septum site-determining protein MinC [Aquificota bacterium]
MSIEIKGATVPALVIRLPKNKDFDKSLKELENKLSSAFFKGSLAIIEHDENLSKEEKEKIENLLKKHNTGILAYRQSSKANSVKEKKSLKIINKTVRSGQRVEYDGDVLIIGDVNPDAYVIASGNIIVMGTLRGIVHAGANGDETAVIMALKLKPQQLRIASYITRSPDEPSGEPEYPEKAFIENQQIFIEKI